MGLLFRRISCQRAPPHLITSHQSVHFVPSSFPISASTPHVRDHVKPVNAAHVQIPPGLHLHQTKNTEELPSHENFQSVKNIILMLEQRMQQKTRESIVDTLFVQSLPSLFVAVRVSLEPRVQLGLDKMLRAVRDHFNRLSRRKGTDEDVVGHFVGGKSNKRHYWKQKGRGKGRGNKKGDAATSSGMTCIVCLEIRDLCPQCPKRKCTTCFDIHCDDSRACPCHKSTAKELCCHERTSNSWRLGYRWIRRWA